MDNYDIDALIESRVTIPSHLSFLLPLVFQVRHIHMCINIVQNLIQLCQKLFFFFLVFCSPIVRSMIHFVMMSALMQCLSVFLWDARNDFKAFQNLALEVLHY